MMERLVERIERLENVIVAAAIGDFSQQLDVTDEDAFASLEHGINMVLEEFRALLEEDRRKARSLEEKQLAIIRMQEVALQELSTPIMQVWDDVLLLPIVGVVDTKRSMDIMNALLEAIANTQSRCVIIDITGVEIVDTKTADYLLKVVRAANLLGARVNLTGLNPAVAQTLVAIGADLSEVRTLRNLREGLKDCLQFLSQQMERDPRGRT